MFKHIPVRLVQTNAEDRFEPGLGVVVGYIKKGDYYRSDVLKFLKVENLTPVASKFDVLLVKRTDKPSSIIIPRDIMSSVLELQDPEDYNVLQKIFEHGSYFSEDMNKIKKKTKKNQDEKQKKPSTVKKVNKKKVEKKASLTKRVGNFLLKMVGLGIKDTKGTRCTATVKAASTSKKKKDS